MRSQRRFWLSPPTRRSGSGAAIANFYAYVVSGAFGGVVMMSAAVVILRTGVFPQWLGWAGTVIGVAAIASTATLVENDPRGLFATINGFAWLAYFLWIAAISVRLLRPSQASR